MTDKADNDALVREALSAVLAAQRVDPYRGWSITELNKAADQARELLGLPSVRELNPDIAAMQDHAAENKGAILAALRSPAPVVDETGWLIELPLSASGGGRLCWVALEDGPFPLFRTMNHREDYDFQKIASPLRFTPESNEAIRFARKVDAENFMAKFDRYLLHAVVTEHAWPEVTRPQPDETETLRAEVARLRKLVNTPVTDEFANGVNMEALHQRERWGSEHDAGKTPEDWFWLIGYLAQKALRAQNDGDLGKAMHHTVSTGAALANWHLALTGVDTSMRPGIEQPKGTDYGQ